MKYLIAMIWGIGTLLLAGCDNQSRHVEQLLRCNLAVEALGSPQAKKNFARNEVTVFTSQMQDITPDELLVLDSLAREELKSPSLTARNQLVRMVATWNSQACMDLHQQAAISGSQLQHLLGG
ncbi:hypothetical protein F9C28_14605 [Shimwellia pseudoproteus]|uniref:hypothetical protein n=1 Tax=Shimwellia pseudoproteus TaxID=570012 RepID=UPI0018EA4BF7|nr:hypothetical protein [Shimwellia pseudoproteus]MBJ3816126.1 hypothetical protein [Shimwellia pseudoproteus]